MLQVTWTHNIKSYVAFGSRLQPTRSSSPCLCCYRSPAYAASNTIQQSLSLLLQASKTSKPQAKAGQKKPAVVSRKKQPVVLSDSAGSEEEEEKELSSEDGTEHLEIERVLDGRPNASSKQEEFLVKFKGNAPSLHAPSFHAASLHADHPCLVVAEHAMLAAYEKYNCPFKHKQMQCANLCAK